MDSIQPFGEMVLTFFTRGKEVKTKAIRDLSQLKDEQLFREISEGLELIFKHASCVWSDAKHLSENKRAGGYNILKTIAEEEAAKFLILLDAIRCPRVPPDNFSRQLKKFDEHLAKGIYTLYYSFKPMNFGEVRKIIEEECRQYYLDGLEGFEWIFHNSIVQEREEKIYVDYMESEGEHIWFSPERYYRPEMTITSSSVTPSVLEVIEAMCKVGLAKPEALAIIAKKWRSTAISDELLWRELQELNVQTLQELAQNGLLVEQPNPIYRVVVDKWLFPLYSIDIRMIKVDKQELREIRERRAFDLYY